MYVLRGKCPYFMASVQSAQTGKSFRDGYSSSTEVLSLLRITKCLVAIAAMLLISEAWSQTTLTGGGATFPYPIYARWFAEFHKLHPNIEIEYNAIGSGAGIREITAGVYDFAASDAPMDNNQLKVYQAKRGTELLHFPTVLGAVVPMYNVPEVNAELKFTPEILANVYLGKITKWNDPEIAKTNPDAKLPSQKIIVVFRSDSSGTTYIWTDYLAKVSEAWDNEVGYGTTAAWPVGLGGPGNGGVARLIKETPYSLGYVELAYAIKNKLPYGSVQNHAGKFIKANLESVTAAAAGVAKAMPDDFRVSITDAPGEDSYPISSFTWLLVPAECDDKSKLKTMKDFLHWMSTDGQDLTEELQYAPLPKEVLAKEQSAFSKLH